MKEDYAILVVEPTEEELSKLQEITTIPMSELDDALEKTGTARLEYLDELKWYKIVFRLPLSQDEITENLVLPMVIFLDEKRILEIFPRRYEIKKHKIIKHLLEKGTPFALFIDSLQLLTESNKSQLEYLEEKMQKAEEEIIKTIRPKSILQIFQISKNSIHLDASLKGNLKVYNRLLQMEIFKGKKDVVEKMLETKMILEEQVELMATYRELLENSLDAYASVISNNQNELIKFLTTISLILIFPTLIASLYGMNVNLPLAGTPYSFWIVLAIMVVSTALVFTFFKLRKWI